MSWMIKVEDVSKMYRLGLIGNATIQDDVKRFLYKIRGKDDPFIKIGEENQRNNSGGDYVWALKDINFKVNQGEVLGIIGRNGAGKSTLLKLLSKVTKPTTGSITTKGRIASLLEVGTGFHPELTGRENIFLNGAILGMKKNEIKRKFDEIADFSGCERYIDTPVKRYSSGMYVRLAFAVAAHLEPEILVVDEVLAVGDADFQKKAINKMKDVSTNEGRTVLFVSHNMASIKSLCNNAIVLKNGEINFHGSTNDALNSYFTNDLKSDSKGVIPSEFKRYNTGEIKIKNIGIIDNQDKKIDEIPYGSIITIRIKLECFKKVGDCLIDIKVVSTDGIIITDSVIQIDNKNSMVLERGEHLFEVKIKNDFQPGNYSLSTGAHYVSGASIEVLENIYDFSISHVGELNNPDYRFNWIHGYISPESKWKKIQI